MPDLFEKQTLIITHFVQSFEKDGAMLDSGSPGYRSWSRTASAACMKKENSALSFLSQGHWFLFLLSAHFSPHFSNHYLSYLLEETLKTTGAPGRHGDFSATATYRSVGWYYSVALHLMAAQNCTQLLFAHEKKVYIHATTRTSLAV
jgi:hypothetical protein